jgi:hypothetical protein
MEARRRLVQEQDRRLLRERLRGAFWLGLVFAMGGAALVLGSDFILHPTLGWGDALALSSGMFYAGYFLATQRARRTLDTLTYVWLVNCSGSSCPRTVALQYESGVEVARRDVKTGEIACLELGTVNYSLDRTFSGVFVGSNIAGSEKVRSETVLDYDDKSTSCTARYERWNQLMQSREKLDVKVAREYLADHYDSHLKNLNVLKEVVAQSHSYEYGNPPDESREGFWADYLVYRDFMKVRREKASYCT